MKRPVLIIGYNRPKNLAQVIRIAAEAPVSELFIWLDGPKPDIEEDADMCEESRQVVDSALFPFPVTKHFSKRNLGCRDSVVGAITWFFSHVEAGIILEDDCVPSLGFFEFADKMLSRYATNSKVLTISGHQRLAEWSRDPFDYHFSRYPNVWGWATWSRVWSQFDPAIEAWPQIRRSRWPGGQTDLAPDAARYWRYQFDRVHSGQVDTWDYQLTFLSMITGGLNISPHKNFISNIGFDSTATHTAVAPPAWLISQTSSSGNLQKAPPFSRDREKDRQTELLVFRTKKTPLQYARLLGRLLKNSEI